MPPTTNRHRALALCALLGLPLAAAAFPDKPIEWVVPYPPGGGSDVVARVLAEPMGKSLGTMIVVDNKPGAAINIGATYARSEREKGGRVIRANNTRVE